jgi:hypothetical protein
LFKIKRNWVLLFNFIPVFKLKWRWIKWDFL